MHLQTTWALVILWGKKATAAVTFWALDAVTAQWWWERDETICWKKWSGKGGGEKIHSLRVMWHCAQDAFVAGVEQQSMLDILQVIQRIGNGVEFSIVMTVDNQRRWRPLKNQREMGEGGNNITHYRLRYELTNNHSFKDVIWIRHIKDKEKKLWW